MARNNIPSLPEQEFKYGQSRSVKQAIQEANYNRELLRRHPELADQIKQHPTSRIKAGVGAWIEQKKSSMYGGGRTKTGGILRMLGQQGAGEFYDTMFGKQKPRWVGDQKEKQNTAKLERAQQQTAAVMSGVAKTIEQVSSSLTAFKQELGIVKASVLDVRRNMGDIGSDVSDIKSLIMPRNITAKGKPLTDSWGRQDKSKVGKIQFAQYNPLAPAGAQFLQQNVKQLGGGFFTRGGLTSKAIEPGFMQDAIKQASMQTAILTLKIQKKDASKAELRRKNDYSDPTERKLFETDPIIALRDEMRENFAKLFALLKGLRGYGDDGFGIDGLPLPIPLGGGKGKGARGKGRRGATSSKAKERYKRRYGKRAAGKRFGGKGGGSILGLGALAGGYLGYKLFDSMRDESLESEDPEMLKEQAAAATKSGDVEGLRKTRTQIAKQKEDVEIQMASNVGAVGGAAAGAATTKVMWKLFVNFVKRKAPQLAARIGTRLAASGVMASVPVIGWIGAAISLGFTAWMAWDLYQLWKEFQSLSDAEKEAYTDEAVRLDESKDKPGAELSALSKPPDYEMARQIESTATKTGPTTRGGRRGRNATPAPATASKPASTTGVLSASQASQGARGGRNTAPSSAEGKKNVMEAMDAAGITGAHRASLLAQLHHESNGFRRLEENLNYSADRLMQVFPKYYKNPKDAEEDAGNPQKIAMRVYGKRSDLGNSSAEDGWKYRGRGYIQLTGKSNYEQFGKLIGMDLVNNPSLAAHPKIAAKIAVAYYKSRVIDKGIQGEDVKGVTKAIQGGSLGLEERGELTAMYSGDSAGGLATPASTHKGAEIDGESRQVKQAQQQAPVMVAMTTPAPAPAPAARGGPSPGAVSMARSSATTDDSSLIRAAQQDTTHPVYA